MDDIDKELDRQIKFKIEYDKIMREADLREKGGLRPRPEPKVTPPQGPSSSFRMLSHLWLNWR